MRLTPIRVVASEREDGREREERERNSVQEWRVDMIESVASLKLERVSDIVVCEMRMEESPIGGEDEEVSYSNLLPSAQSTP